MHEYLVGTLVGFTFTIKSNNFGFSFNVGVDRKYTIVKPMMVLYIF